jgi:hypothetical protein
MRNGMGIDPRRFRREPEPAQPSIDALHQTTARRSRDQVVTVPADCAAHIEAGQGGRSGSRGEIERGSFRGRGRSGRRAAGHREPKTLYAMKKDSVRPIDHADALALRAAFDLEAED